MRDCTIRAFDGCSCQEGECRSKAVQLGRFEKPRPSPYDTTVFQYVIVFLFLAISLWAGVSFGQPESKRIELAQQESGR